LFRSCHQPQECKVPKGRLLQKSPDNNCVQGHMPSSSTDIPHVAFTHHRVAVHEKLPRLASDAAQAGGGTGKLRLFLDRAPLSEVDKQRSLGLAYLVLANAERDAEREAAYRSQAFQLLSGAYNAGLRDPTLEAPLARLYF